MNAAKVAFAESAQPMDELSAMNWATARSVLVACVPVLARALPYLGEHLVIRCKLVIADVSFLSFVPIAEVPLNQILERAASFVIPA